MATTSFIVVGLILEALGIAIAYRGLTSSVVRYDGSRDTRWEARGLFLIAFGIVSQIVGLLLG